MPALLANLPGKLHCRFLRQKQIQVLKKHSSNQGVILCSKKPQNQPPRGVLKKKCSENIHQIYRRTPMPKCDFHKVALQTY